MSNARWQRIQHLYHEALERPASARAAFLSETCAGDSALLQEVQSLLDQPISAEQFLVSGDSGASDDPPSVHVGQRLGIYQVEALIGRGGMGEVYRARDTTLGRDVAIKILPAAFTSDPARRARFEREGRLLATLNHPHVASIHGLDDAAGVQMLVMELVDGQTLAERLTTGPLPIADVLTVSRQIAEALEAAHEKGIVHRDLKPANIKITPDESVKVLDFGLAKMAQASDPPTIMVGGTREGAILGTAAYMSPEQARGKPVDKRADIWAFGCVLYEMLTGHQAFGGESVSDTIAGILEREPDWRALPEETAATIRRLVKRCLEKDPKRRLHDIADARLEIEDALSGGASRDVGLALIPARRTRLPIALAFLCGLGLAASGAFVYFPGPPPDLLAVRFAVNPPDGVTWAPTNANSNQAPNTVLAVSPDGRRVVYTGRTANGSTSLFVRSLETVDSQPLLGTDGATSPFWSPNSRSVGFFADGKLKRIDAAGGAVTTLCEAGEDRGGTWGDDGVIVFATFPGPLQKISAAGGVPTPASTLATDEPYHARPQFLPGGRRFIYRGPGNTLRPEGGRRSSVDEPSRQNPYYLGSIDSTDRTLLFSVDSGNVAYSEGYLLFVQNESTLMAQPFDQQRLALTGAPIPVAERIRMSTGNRPLFGVFSASQTGALAYLSRGGGPGSGLTWFDRSGAQLDVLSGSNEDADPVLSEDGTRVSVTRRDPTVNTRDIWLFDLARKVPTRLTLDPQEDRDLVWAPDGRHVVFASNRRAALTAAPTAESRYDLFQRALSGPATDEVLLEGGHSKFPTSWSHDGRFILYDDFALPFFLPNGVWVLPLADRKPFPFIQSPQFYESQGQFSPDGRWVAYVSNESGTFEVYVAPFPGAETRHRVSTAGGTRPRWRRDGREIFFRSPDNKLMAAAVSVAGTAFTVGEVKALFDTEVIRAGSPSYAVRADGQGFLLNTSAAAPMTVVLNWRAGLKK